MDIALQPLDIGCNASQCLLAKGCQFQQGSAGVLNEQSPSAVQRA